MRRLLGVPVFGAEGLLGVLHVGSPDATDLHARGHRAPGRCRGRDRPTPLGADSRTTRTWRRWPCSAACCRPRRRPLEGLDVAVRYLPAEGDLGGDWYDIFTLPSGKVGFVMGDVEGHGLRLRGRHGPAAQRAAGLRPRLRGPRRGAAPPRPQGLLLRGRHLGDRRVRRQRAALRRRDDLQRRPPGAPGRPTGDSRSPRSRTSRPACCSGSTRSTRATARRSRSRRGPRSRSTPTASSSADACPTSSRTRTSSAWTSCGERSCPPTAPRRPAAGSSPRGSGTTASRTTSPWSSYDDRRDGAGGPAASVRR